MAPNSAIGCDNAGAEMRRPQINAIHRNGGRMSDPTIAPVLKDLMLFLATAGVVAPIFARLRVGSTLGFLAAGVIAREERTYAETLLQKPKTVDKKIELF